MGKKKPAERRRPPLWTRLGARLDESPPPVIEVPARTLTRTTRRDFLLFGAGTAAAAAAFWWLLPDDARGRWLPDGAHHALDTLAARAGLSKERRERFLDRTLDFDDDVAEALYSRDRRVRTYRRSDIQELRNNYNGATPNADYIASWRLSVSGLASGQTETLAIDDLRQRFPFQEQITRLICVEGWSAVAWWGGIRFADFLRAYPPAAGSRFAALESGVNLDASGNQDPYYVSLDLATAMHPQTLLATHHNGKPLAVEHGAPLRLIVPVKLGLKNIKAITDLSFSAEEPDDYWAKRGYSKYDGL